MDLSKAIADLDAEIDRLQKARSVLADLNSDSNNTRATPGSRKGKTMSPAARRRISLAKKKWWAARRKG
jgi:hypothetical protein